jgi:flavin reductase (DIM6/NTAB) family NADH-FMN oxidoreductase RutF
MPIILPADLSHRDRHQLLLGGVSPRPIALVSSISAAGVSNLSPYSFFNAFASNPPIVGIGPAIAAKTGQPKDTWLNILATGEATISVVSYAMVHKVNLASAPYPSDVDEFTKAGFTKTPSRLVQPSIVAESPYAMECRLMENIELRRDIGGNGNLMLLEVVAFHVSDSVLVDGKIDPIRMDLVGRMGQSYYTRTNNVFQATQPHFQCIGFDALPDHIRKSDVLTGNDLAKLAYVQVLPMFDGSFPRFNEGYRADSVDIELGAQNPMGALYAMLKHGNQHDRVTRHRIAKAFIANDQLDEAWQTLLLE